MRRRACLGWAASCATLSASLSALLCVSAPRLANANPADTFGLGSRSVAMAGAATGRVTDFSANYYNPSGLAFAERTELSFGFVHVAPELELAGQTSELDAIDAWQLGLVVPGELLGHRLAFGVAAQVAGDRLSRVVTFTEEDQRWFVYENRPEQIYLSANVALRLLDTLSVGAGLAFLTSTHGNLQVGGDIVQPVGGRTEFESRLEHEVQAELTASRYASFGLTWAALDALDLGLSYRGEGSVELNVDATIQGDILLGPIEIPTQYHLLSNTIQAYVPEQVTLGARFAASPELDLHFDLCWLNWSELPSPVSATQSEITANPPEGLVVRLPELPPATERQSGGLSDRWLPRLGAEYRIPGSSTLGWAARLGYFYERSALDSGSARVLVDTDRHVMSAGLGVSLRPRAHGAVQPAERSSGVVSEAPADTASHFQLKLDAHVQYGLLPEKALGTGDAQTSARGHFSAGGVVLGLAL